MKGIQQMPCLRDIKGMHSIGARSIPKAQRSDYLELYMVRKEKDRLEKEIFALDKKRSAALRQLNNINQRIEKLQKEANEKQKINSRGGAPVRPLKTMTINY